MKKLRLAAVTLVLVTGLGTASAASAAFSCYSQDKYPAAFGLSEVDGQLQVQLGPDRSQVLQSDRSSSHVASRASDGTWQTRSQPCSADACRMQIPAISSCKLDVPEPVLSLEQMQKLAPEMASYVGGGEDGGDGSVSQTVGACVQQGDIIWFGVTFYCGEGSCGIGGIGRYDSKTHQLEVRRPKLLLSGSVSPIAFDGKYLWVGTYMSTECTGVDVGVGLVRYDWDHDKAVSFGGGTDSSQDPDGPCGFEFNDLYITKEGLWASSDMGLSLLTNPQDSPAQMHWTHFVPTATGTALTMLKRSCADLYSGLPSHHRSSPPLKVNPG